MVTSPKRDRGNLSPVETPPAAQSGPPMTNPIFTRLSGRKKNRVGKLAGFVIVAIIIAAIGLIGLYFATGPHDQPAASRPAVATKSA